VVTETILEKNKEYSVRAYAGTSGIVAAYDYYPYGAVAEIYPGGTLPDERRWQDKDLDDATGNYYFGARFYNPLLGMWLTPDPAGQYVNPYGYGGDPVNLIDPSGLWAIGAGLVVGYDRSHGFGIGLGFAHDVWTGFSYNLGVSWNSDGSISTNASASVSAPIPGTPLWANFGGGYSYNSETGHAVTGQVGVCAGVEGLSCSGMRVGGGLYWSAESEFLGGTAYLEAYATVAGGLAGGSIGEETGFGSMHGRGWYSGFDVAGLYAVSSVNGGFSWGFQESLYYKLMDLGNAPKTGRPRKFVGLSIPTLGIFGDYFMYDHGNRNENPIQKEVMGEGGKGINREQFEELAKEKGLKFGHYSSLGAALHEPNSGNFIWGYIKGLFTGNFPHPTVDKMWMQEGDMHWWQVPAVEGLFTKNGNYYPAPSYNYGNNLISHFFWDMVPYWVFDKSGL
jgi:RHS repeat-associated protein